MAISFPDENAVENYPTSKFQAEYETARALLFKEIDGDGWTDRGETDGVHFYRKDNPSDPSGVPFVKGVTTVPNCTPDQYVATISMENMRKTWDERLETGSMVERYRLRSFAFYSVMKGFGWLVSQRDIFGVQVNERTTNGPYIIVQTSVVDKDTVPEQSGKQRARLNGALWRLTPESGNLKVEYLVSVNLGGSIPSAITSQLANQLPACTGRAAKSFETFGHAPFILPPGGVERELDIVVNSETITTPEKKGKDNRHWKAVLKGLGKSETFEIIYSLQMYDKGVKVVSTNPQVEIVDDGAGKLSITVPVDVTGRFDIEITPK